MKEFTLSEIEVKGRERVVVKLLAVFGREGIILNQLTTGADNRGGKTNDYWYSAESELSNTVMVVL